MTSWRSAQILGHLESEEALPKLRQGVQHKHPDIRRISVEALSRLKCQQATLELLDCLKKDLDYSVRRSAAIALGCAGEEEAIPELLKALRHYHLPADLGINVEVSVKLNGHKTI
jgi:HEAT repeat protein